MHSPKSLQLIDYLLCLATYPNSNANFKNGAICEKLCEQIWEGLSSLRLSIIRPNGGPHCRPETSTWLIIVSVKSSSLVNKNLRIETTEMPEMQ